MNSAGRFLTEPPEPGALDLLRRLPHAAETIASGV